jgi:hypothetical protein
MAPTLSEAGALIGKFSLIISKDVLSIESWDKHTESESFCFVFLSRFLPE